MSRWEAIAEKSVQDVPPTTDEALAVLRAPADELLPILQAAFRVRHHFHGRGVKLHVLLNAKSGLCPEDCHFCSQSSIATDPVERYRLVPAEDMVEAARRARVARAWKF